MIITPDDILDLYDIDRGSRGARMWRSYAWQIADGASAAEAVVALCQAEHMPRAAVYSTMKRTLAPVFETRLDTWAAMGLKPQKTTAGLAYALAEMMKRGEGDG